MEKSQNAEKSKIWDIVLLKDSGAWEGFRAPELALRKTVTYIVVLFLVAAFGTVGWLWSRWELGVSENEVAAHRLEIRALKAQMAATQRGLIKGENPGVSDQLTFFPSLDDTETTSEDLLLGTYKLAFDPQNGELELEFDIEKTSRSALGSEKFYWILLLHGSQGIQSFPPAMVSRAGTWVHPLKGQVIDGFARNRKLNARYRAQGFFESAGIDPVYGSLLVYDSKGSLLVKRRASVRIAELKKGESRR